MSEYATYIGGIAAFLASLSYIPQVRKAWPQGSTKDLSINMLVALTLGLGLWIVYGALNGDWVIILANAIGTTLTAIVLGCKIRDML
jgi:MtN3 and saliva related transmembrane protein